MRHRPGAPHRPYRPSAIRAALLVAALAACGGAESARVPPAAPAPGPTAPPAASEQGGSAVAESTNRFAVELYARLAAEEGNLFFSPLSISTALAMTWAGAAGGTAAEMADVLGFAAGSADVHSGFGALLAGLEQGDPEAGHRLHVANRLWGQEGYAFLEAFLAICRERYGAGLETVDFRRAAEAARGTINEWVAERTERRIEDLLPAGSLDATTRLVLTNAIYFKGDWAEPFDPGATADGPFRLAGGGEVEVPFMRQETRFPYARIGEVQVLKLPYAGERLSMLVVLPDAVDGLAGVEAGLTAERLAGWVEGLGERTVEVHLPRFTVDTRFRLAGELAAMGMPSAFDSGAADFSGMTGNRDLYLDQVFHQAFVAVDEEGTEAAAATGVTMQLTMAVARPPVFRADHPFLFLIRDDDSGAILFLGRLARPS